MLALPTLLLSLRAPSLQPEGQPTPAAGRMILLSRGRGGSTVTCAVFAQLAHSPVWNLCTELFGSRLDQMANVTDPRATMIHWFNEQQVAQPHAQLVGFKWKPWLIDSALYAGAVSWVAAHGVKVLWMTRNALDEAISKQRHTAEHDIDPRCKPTKLDAKELEECIAAHQGAVTMNTTVLMRQLRDFRDHDATIEATLTRANITYHRLDFDTLFVPYARQGLAQRELGSAPTGAAELAVWNGALGYLGLDRVDSYAKIVQAANAFSERTAAKSQCELMANAGEVRAALRGTEFEGLLRNAV